MLGVEAIPAFLWDISTERQGIWKSFRRVVIPKPGLIGIRLLLGRSVTEPRLLGLCDVHDVDVREQRELVKRESTCPSVAIKKEREASVAGAGRSVSDRYIAVKLGAFAVPDRNLDSQRAGGHQSIPWVDLRG